MIRLTHTLICRCETCTIEFAFHNHPPLEADVGNTVADFPDVLDGPRPCVLLIEDNLTQLELYVLTLEEDVDVLTATRGATGYALACTEQPDAIIVDVLVADVDGLEMCARLLANPQTASIPVIALTDDDAYARAIRMGSLDAVLKMPCSVDQLLSAIERAVASRRVH